MGDTIESLDIKIREGSSSTHSILDRLALWLDSGLHSVTRETGGGEGSTDTERVPMEEREGDDQLI